MPGGFARNQLLKELASQCFLFLSIIKECSEYLHLLQEKIPGKSFLQTDSDRFSQVPNSTLHCKYVFSLWKRKHFAILTNDFSNPCFRRIQMYSANRRLLPQRTVPDLRLADGGSSEDSDISSKPSFIFPQTFVVQICLKIGCSIAQRIENNTFLCRVEKCWRRWSWAILEFSYIRYHRGPRVKGVEDGITKI